MSAAREITIQEALTMPDPVFIDVRAPVEFEQDHIPGAINIAVLDDSEREEIGIMYRAQGQESAILKGTGIVGGKLSSIIGRITQFKGRQIVIYCFRGGMRSTSLASLLCSLGIPVYKLSQGYKGYRQWIRARLETLQIIPPVFILHGLTGTGKTRIIRALDYGIDLEDFAGHRSSLFGGLGLAHKSQKMFESLLVRRVDALSSRACALIEGESRKIGDIHVPKPIMRCIQDAPAILITAPMERRVRILMDEYTAGLDRIALAAIVESLEHRIGRKNVDTLNALMESGRFEEFTALLLEKYYDPLYRFSLDRMNFFAVIENTGPADAASETDRVIRSALKGRA